MTSLADLDSPGLAQQFAAWGYKPSHAARVLRSFYDGREIVSPPSRGLPQGLVEKLQTTFPSSAATLDARQVAADGTTKLLLRLADGRTVESVLMPDFRADRAAGCISSQVGCAMGCDFCATTKTGFERNLTAGEIVEQFLALRREASAGGRKLQTVVFMGMGEPMLNLDAVLIAVRRLADNALGALGWRQITVSTVGIVPGIEALTATGLNVHLAVSLHAPDDATRARLLPMGKRFPIADILAAADRFQARRGRPVTIQYCLLAGVNDSLEHARLLAELLGSRRMHINLLRYNPTGLSLRGVTYEPSSDEAAEAFAAVLRARKLVAHFRRSRGPDIDAACGQLRRRTGGVSEAACGGAL
ncbi:MAG: 23S rRNA (adenine(2503)-C(2))-methyltransferase RlmN [Verrucomicrobia bacterium]|nr:23S rRNA (adenine(2503)-C(2))-methyltransferase RlmN [Verrucomicrobiota bacterium]